jgi:hypothetical protein
LDDEHDRHNQKYLERFKYQLTNRNEKKERTSAKKFDVNPWKRSDWWSFNAKIATE